MASSADEPGHDPPPKRARLGCLQFKCPLRAAVYYSKGRKQALEDVAVYNVALDVDGLATWHAVIDGHGGAQCAALAATRLPALIAEGIRDIEASGIEASIAIKDAIKAAFTTCEREVLPLVDDGCCVIGMLVDRRCTPARAYVANLGDSRAFACVEPAAATADAAAGTSTKTLATTPSCAAPSTKTLATAPSCAAPAVRAIALSKDHVATDPKERRRIEVAGGVIEHGRVCGMLEVTRSLGDRLVKQRLRKGESAKGEGISAVPDVTSFAVGLEQRFVLMASDGFWKAWTSSEAIEVLHARLCAMDRRREVLATALDEPTAASALTREAHAALIKEREGATEEGCLKEMVHEAVHMRHAKDNVTALLVRMPPAP
jgi:hypothetical protein